MKEIIKVEPLEDYKLLLTFENNEKKIKDMKPYLNKGIFKKLKDINFFNEFAFKPKRFITETSEIQKIANRLL